MSYLPGNIAFFLVLSIFPILTLIGVIASRFSINIEAIIDMINTAFPSNISNIIADFMQPLVGHKRRKFLFFHESGRLHRIHCKRACQKKYRGGQSENSGGNGNAL